MELDDKHRELDDDRRSPRRRARTRGLVAVLALLAVIGLTLMVTQADLTDVNIGNTVDMTDTPIEFRRSSPDWLPPTELVDYCAETRHDDCEAVLATGCWAGTEWHYCVASAGEQQWTVHEEYETTQPAGPSFDGKYLLMNDTVLDDQGGLVNPDLPGDGELQWWGRQNLLYLETLDGWDLFDVDGRLVDSIAGPAAVSGLEQRQVTVSPDGERLLVGYGNITEVEEVWTTRIGDQSWQPVYSDPNGFTPALLSGFQFSSDGQSVLLVSFPLMATEEQYEANVDENGVFTYQILSVALDGSGVQRRISVRTKASVYLSFSPDGTMAALGGAGTNKIVDLNTGLVSEPFEVGCAQFGMRWSPGSTMVLSDNGILATVKLATGDQTPAVEQLYELTHPYFRGPCEDPDGYTFARQR